jgi:2'-5' RNA ligase
MGLNRNLYFVAVLPPEDIQEEVRKIKLIFKNQYGAEHALNSPAHLTLIPPFQWPVEKETDLEGSLDLFNRKEVPFEVELNGMGAFRPRVIYIDVVKNDSLSGLHKRLKNLLEAKWNIPELRRDKKPFNPHMTVAFRDLKKENFLASWDEFKDKKFQARFTVDRIVLLIHRLKRWEVCYQSFFGEK